MPRPQDMAIFLLTTTTTMTTRPIILPPCACAQGIYQNYDSSNPSAYALWQGFIKTKATPNQLVVSHPPPLISTRMYFHQHQLNTKVYRVDFLDC